MTKYERLFIAVMLFFIFFLFFLFIKQTRYSNYFLEINGKRIEASDIVTISDRKIYYVDSEGNKVMYCGDYKLIERR